MWTGLCIFQLLERIHVIWADSWASGMQGDRLRRAEGGPAKELGGFTHNSSGPLTSGSLYTKQSGEAAGMETRGVTGVWFGAKGQSEQAWETENGVLGRAGHKFLSAVVWRTGREHQTSYLSLQRL